ncbi:MAG: PAS domain S-box protein [Candidatus Thorarchaeota archaeon]
MPKKTAKGETTIHQDTDSLNDRNHTINQSESDLTLLMATLEAVSDGLFVIDHMGENINFNRKFISMWGIPDSIIESQDYKKAIDFILEQLEDPESFLSKSKQAEGDLDAGTYDILKLKDGRIFERHSRPRMIGDHYAGRILSFRDVTEHKKMEQVARESERAFRELTDQLPQTVFEMDLEGNFTYANRYGLEAFGYSQEDIENGLNFINLFAPEDRERAIQNALMKLQGEKLGDYEYTLMKRDGTPFPVLIYSSRILGRDNQPIGLRGIVIDNAERKKAEEALRESERKYRELVEKLHEGVLVADENRNITFVNPRLAEMLDYNEEELIGQHTSTIVPTEDRNRVNEEYAKRIKGISSTYESNLLAKSGRIIPVIISGTGLISATGTYKGVLALFTNISRLKIAEEAQRESEEKYRTILENIEDGYYESDLAGNLTFFNDSLCRILGYPRDNLLGMNNRYFMDNETSKLIFQAHNNVYKTGKPIQAIAWEVIRKDGTRRFVESSISLLRDSFGQPIGFRGIIRDIHQFKILSKLHEAVLETSFDGIAVLDLEGTILLANKPLIGMSGRTRDELVGLHLSDIIIVSEFVTRLIESAKKGQKILNFETSLNSKKGTQTIPVELSSGPLEGEEKILVVFRDLRPHKELSEELDLFRAFTLNHIRISLFKLGLKGPEVVITETLPFSEEAEEEIFLRMGLYYTTALGQGNEPQMGLYGPLPAPGLAGYVSMVHSFMIRDSSYDDPRSLGKTYAFLVLSFPEELAHLFSNRTVITESCKNAVSHFADIQEVNLDALKALKSQILGFEELN